MRTTKNRWYRTDRELFETCTSIRFSSDQSPAIKNSHWRLPFDEKGFNSVRSRADEGISVRTIIREMPEVCVQVTAPAADVNLIAARCKEDAYWGSSLGRLVADFFSEAVFFLNSATDERFTPDRIRVFREIENQAAVARASRNGRKSSLALNLSLKAWVEICAVADVIGIEVIHHLAAAIHSLAERMRNFEGANQAGPN